MAGGNFAPQDLRPSAQDLPRARGAPRSNAEERRGVLGRIRAVAARRGSGNSIAQPSDRAGGIPHEFGNGAGQTAPTHRSGFPTLPNRRAPEPRSLRATEHLREQSLGDASSRTQATPRASRRLVDSRAGTEGFGRPNQLSNHLTPNFVC